VVIITLGKRGALVYEKRETSRVPSFPTKEVVDTTGAGDAFASGVVSGMLRGFSWANAARYGNVVAALKIAYLGARVGLPERQEADANYQAWTEVRE
jgi:sugar/nucleoside kinase (ribokinase family)